jgi:energy-coupling factor transporter ATP-binding protein EcfA2
MITAQVERNSITEMGGGRDPMVYVSDSSDETNSKLSWSAEESNQTGIESVDLHSEPGTSLPWISLSRVQVSGVLEVQNKIDENCEIDESYQKAPKALLFMPVSGQVNKVQVRGKLEVQSEIVIDESCPETAKLLLSMPARGQLNKVQVSGELEIQNIIVTGESFPNSCEASIQTLPKDCICKNHEVANWTMKLKDADGSHELDFERKNKDRADKVSRKSSTEDEQFENHQENTSALEDITLNQLPFLHGLEGHSREEHRRAEMRRKITQKTAMQKMRYDRIQDEKERLLRYRPGAWLIETGGINRNHYEIPIVTTLLLVGPKGAGKSTLINNILRVLSRGNERLDRAQVFCKSSAESGSLFLQEYMVPGTSKGFCIFDSRGLLENVAEDFPILENWMFNGIQHGEMVLRSSDDNTTKRMFMKRRACDRPDNFSKIRKVNFVIFVVSAFSVFQIMENADTLASDTLVKLFGCPYLSFKDDKPMVVMTHGDELDDSDRIRAHVFLGELLGVSAVDQVFDISDGCNPAEDIALLDMLEHSLQRADKNHPYREKRIADHFDSILKELSTVAKWALKNVKVEEVVSFGILVVLAILVWLHFRALNHAKEPKIDWHRIRHLWLG